MPTLSEIIASALLIRNEEASGANTAERVGDALLDIISFAAEGFSFTTGYFNVEVESGEEPQDITLYTLDFANLPGQIGTPMEYGAGGEDHANCTGYIEGWVCMLDAGSGAGTNKEWWFSQKVQRRAGNNIETRGPLVFDPKSDEPDPEVEGDVDPEFGFVNGPTMPIVMTTHIPENVTRLVVRVRGKLTNQVRA
ncbi:MAG TPA: hypothetical protein VHO25_18085 [Polyangiaceae bacterium]|nr:hypothetical protein [Polyangiaceae bacterium]